MVKAPPLPTAGSSTRVSDIEKTVYTLLNHYFTDAQLAALRCWCVSHQASKGNKVETAVAFTTGLSEAELFLFMHELKNSMHIDLWRVLTER